MPITFQDPIFNAADEVFLTTYLPTLFTSATVTVTVTVVKDPEAFSLVDSGTFLFAPHLECGVFARALEGSKPVLCIGSDIAEYVDG